MRRRSRGWRRRVPVSGVNPAGMNRTYSVSQAVVSRSGSTLTKTALALPRIGLQGEPDGADRRRADVGAVGVAEEDEDRGAAERGEVEWPVVLVDQADVRAPLAGRGRG